MIVLALADLNGDGLLDLVMGEQMGKFHLFYNSGTNTTPVWKEHDRTTSPLKDISTSTSSTGAFADFNGDGLQDFVCGEGMQSTLPTMYYNTGNATHPSFTMVLVGSDPFAGITLASGYYCLCTIDLDRDGLMDIVLGTGTLTWLRNTGTASSPAFTKDETVFGNVGSLGNLLCPAAGDLNKDGVPDLLVSEQTGKVKYLQITSVAVRRGLSISGQYQYAEITGDSNPFYSFDATQNPGVAIADFDSDGA